MSEVVKCDICGKVYNRSYLHGHKRLAHGKRDVASLVKTEREGLKAIGALETKLPDKNKMSVRKELLRSNDWAHEAAYSHGIANA